MTQLILQPAGNQGSRDHYRDTVASPVALERISTHVDVDTANRLRIAFPSGAASVWGVTPGGRDVNVSKWQRISDGDVALFLKDGRAESAATVVLKTRNAPLARDLWDEKGEGETWEYIYFLRDVRPLDMTYDELNALLGYESANRFQGFTVVSEQKSVAAIARITGQPAAAPRRVWWVNQGQAYRQQREGGLIWAPKLSQSGAALTAYSNVMRLMSTDLIVHYAGGVVRAIGRLTAPPHEAPRPANFPAATWNDDGYLAKVEYRDLATPLDLDAIPLAWRTRESAESPDGPFQKSGKVKVRYLSPLSDRFVQRMIERFPGLLEDGVIETKSELSGLAAEAAADFQASGLLFGESDIARFLAALLAKPFVILTGLAGSGKTKLAQGFAYWIGATPASECCCVIAVGADWTSKDSILGYANALDRGAYERTEALGLIMHAQQNEGVPHFLILDEMNLSHVERYFADILSSMESGEPVRLHMAGDLLDGVPPKLRLPPNLYVIGTVNVDETTYMFSPKVLDRANVLEFQATRERIQALLANPRRPDLEALAGRGAEFRDLSTRRATVATLPLDVQQRLQEETLLFFDVLATEGLEFGYRVAFEMEEFLRYHRATLRAWTFEAGLDAQIVQKLLPRLHGSQRKIEGTLAALASLCYEQRRWEGPRLANAATLRGMATEIAQQPSRDVQRLLLADPATARYPMSFAKLQRMLRHLERNGFTSFAEA